MPVHSFEYAGKSFSLKGVHENDYIFQQIREGNSFYEIPFLEYLSSLGARLATTGDTAVDVGSNIGNHAVFFGSFVASRVVCIEPNADLYAVLLANLEQHLQSRYSIFQGGLGEEEGFASLYLPAGAEGNVGAAALTVGEGIVPVTTLDALLQRLRNEGQFRGGVSMIKIDVEGMELAVLKGARETLAAYHPHLFVEAATKRHYEVLRDHLAPTGYEPLLHWGATPLWHFAFKPDIALKARAFSLKARRSLMWRMGRLLSRRTARPVS